MRSAHLSALLAKYGIAPCGHHSCLFGRLPGPGCTCLDGIPGGGVTTVRAFVWGLAAIIRELDQQPEQIAAWLDRCGCPAIADDVRAGRWKELG